MKRLREAPKRIAQPSPCRMREAADQREIVRDGLAEADAGIDQDAGARDARRLGGGDPARRGSRRPRAARRRRRARPAWSSGRPARASGRPAGRRRRRAARLSGSKLSAETSLSRSAPAANAARATAALRVSMEIGTVDARRRAAPRSPARRGRSPRPRGPGRRRGGSTRRRCRGCRRPPPPSPGRAPTASSRRRWSPPSEKLSGVTFSTPMSRGRSSGRPQTGGRGALRRARDLLRQRGGGRRPGAARRGGAARRRRTRAGPRRGRARRRARRAAPRQRPEAVGHAGAGRQQLGDGHRGC